MILKQLVRYDNADALEATWVDENDVVIKCHAYSNGQMDMLRADLGADAAAHEALIAEVEATYVESEPAIPSSEQMIIAVQQAVQQRLDEFARTREYDGILSACTYSTSLIPKFAAEGQKALKVRDLTWATCYAILSDVREGLRNLPSVDQVLSELPILSWDDEIVQPHNNAASALIRMREK